MTWGPGTVAPSSPQRGTSADGDRAGTLYRHPNGADGDRPVNGMQLRRRYGLLALADPAGDPAGDPAATGNQVRGDGHGATMGTDDQGRRAMETGDETRKQRTTTGNKDPPNGSARLTSATTKGRKEGGGGESCSARQQPPVRDRRGTPRYGSACP